MTPDEKIAKVLKQIWEDSRINPNPKWVKFNFNYNLVGSGILSEDEERRILFKLEKEGVIKLNLSEFENNESKEVIVESSEAGREFLTSQYYWIEILGGFENKYRIYEKYLKPKEPRIEKNKTIRNKNGKFPRVFIATKWFKLIIIPLGLPIIASIFYFFIYPLLLPIPKLDFSIINKDQNLVIGIKNIGKTGIRNLTITKLSEIYFDKSGEYDGFAGTVFQNISEFNNPGENWLMSEYLSPGGLPLEKEMSWPVNGDEYTSVEIFSVYYQRESDLKQFSKRLILLTRNQKAYTIDEAEDDPYLAKVVKQIPEIIKKPPSPFRYYNGVKELK